MTRTARRKRRTPEEIRDRVIEAAGEAFEALGYSRATTAEIARRADVTEAQIFRYFDSKSQLFEAAVFEPLNRAFAEFNARMLSAEPSLESFREGTPGYITALQDFMERHSKGLMALVMARAYEKAAGAAPAIGEDLREYFDIGAAAMRQRVGPEPRVDPDLMVRVSFAAVLGCALFKDWLFPPGLAGEEAIRRATIDFVVDGVNANTEEGWNR
ncbi:MAG: helix-turn-helix domain-containing protein [Novosphingobium sp.]